MIGAAEPPAGSVPDFANPRDVYHTASVASHYTCLVLVTFFFFVRVYVKAVIRRRELLLEDCTPILVPMRSQ